MKAYIFPGQGAQFSGMGKDLYESSSIAKDLFNQANEILGFDITKIMFEGTDDELKETKVRFVLSSTKTINCAYNYKITYSLDRCIRCKTQRKCQNNRRRSIGQINSSFPTLWFLWMSLP